MAERKEGKRPKRREKGGRVGGETGRGGKDKRGRTRKVGNRGRESGVV